MLSEEYHLSPQFLFLLNFWCSSFVLCICWFSPPFPRVSAPPVCPLQSSCTWCDASINQFKVLKFSTSSVSFMCFVPFRYSSTLNNFPQSSLSGFFTPRVTHDTGSWMSLRALYDKNSSCATALWNATASSSGRCSANSSA